MGQNNLLQQLGIPIKPLPFNRKIDPIMDSEDEIKKWIE